MTLTRAVPANSPIWGRWGGGWEWKLGIDAAPGVALIYLGWWGWRLTWETDSK